uniref:CASP-like protein n=1 Tax=Nicotiana tabacum TaxID=4097 RepID=A0A1S4CCW5_TOBAC|nr:PREDICTED: CASP-like protein 4D1 [Nicotiana tabacum]
MATSKRTIINSIAVLRILTLASCTAALALIVTNNFKLDGDKTKFSDIKGFRYVLAAAAGGVLYSLIQLPFALYHAVKEKRLIKGDFLPMFEFYGDKDFADTYAPYSRSAAAQTYVQRIVVIVQNCRSFSSDFKLFV